MLSVSLALVALATPAAVFADQHPIKTVSWQELQGRCADPNNWPDLQGVVPSNIQIECSNVERGWVPTEPGTIPMSADRQVAAAVTATKFTVNSANRALTAAGQTGSCTRYKEQLRTSNIVVPVDCGMVLGWKGDPVDFCQNIFDSGKGTGPKETVVQDTGKVIDSCAGIPGAVEPKPNE
jgi:hypothetical protein